MESLRYDRSDPWTVSGLSGPSGMMEETFAADGQLNKNRFWPSVILTIIYIINIISLISVSQINVLKMFTWPSAQPVRTH